jgi:hypothetical protein
MQRCLGFGLCLCLVSCSGSKYGDHPPYPVSGQVLVNGQPAQGAAVVLRHIDDWGEKTIVPIGWTDEEGRFDLSTYAVKDGAPAGEYKVEIAWPAYKKGRNIGPDKLGGKFSNPDKSGLTVRVQEKTNVLAPFELNVELVDVPAFDPKKGRGHHQ